MMHQLSGSLVIIPIFILLAAMFWMMPYLTRKEIFFGIRLSPALRDKINKKKILFYYTKTFIISMLFFLVLAVLVLPLLRTEIMITVLVFVQLLICFAVYMKYYFAVREWKAGQPANTRPAPEVISVDTSFHRSKMTINIAWYIIPIVLVMIHYLLIYLNFDKIPQQIPMQFDFSGTVTKYVEKSPRSVLFFPTMSLAFIALFIFVNWTIRKSKQQLNSENPEISREQNRKFRYVWSVYLYGMALLMSILFFSNSLSLISVLIKSASVLLIINLVIIVIVILGAIVLSVKYGQAGNRINVKKVSADSDAIDRDDDNYWKLGQFYFNPDDPAIFIDKRMGIGWTLNWARPSGIILFVSVIAIIIFISTVLTR